MFYLPKLEHPVWHNWTIRFCQENLNIWFFQTVHINKKAFTIDFKHHTSIYSSEIR
jgi:hypothetical protein